ncbi:hypothetical protein HY500_00685, partial [Candidatus Woesearchaeota archaeon]|nr:hypothetical protein [Candidatus Woesearchaeota archaeon]
MTRNRKISNSFWNFRKLNFTLLIFVILVIVSSFYFWRQSDLTGFAVKEEFLTLTVNSYVNEDSVIIFKTDTEEIQKKVSELNLELINGSYYVDILNFDINELGLELEKNSIVTAALIDDGSIIAETEIKIKEAEIQGETITAEEPNQTTELTDETEVIIAEELNQTINETETIPEPNQTAELNETIQLQNETEEIQAPENEEANETQTLIINQTISTLNQTIELNQTLPLLNQTAINETAEANKSEQLLQLRAEINKPVKWKKKIK